MKLFIAPGTIAVAVAIALEEAKLPHDLVRIDFATAEQTKPEYLAINPKGRVPALITDTGAVLSETGALLEYVAALAPDANLVPTDPEQAAHMRSVMYYLATTMHVAHAHKLRGHRWADRPESHADMTAKVPQTMRASAAYVETVCLRGDFVLGGQLSLADFYLFAVCNWLEGDGVKVSDFPRIERFMTTMTALPSVRTITQAGVLGQ